MIPPHCRRSPRHPPNHFPRPLFVPGSARSSPPPRLSLPRERPWGRVPRFGSPPRRRPRWSGSNRAVAKVTPRDRVGPFPLPSYPPPHGPGREWLRPYPPPLPPSLAPRTVSMMRIWMMCVPCPLPPRAQWRDGHQPRSTPRRGTLTQSYGATAHSSAPHLRPTGFLRGYPIPSHRGGGPSTPYFQPQDPLPSASSVSVGSARLNGQSPPLLDPASRSFVGFARPDPSP